MISKKNNTTEQELIDEIQMKNVVRLKGRVKERIVMHYVNGGRLAVAEIKLKVYRGYERTGKEKNFDIIDIVVFGRKAEFCANYVIPNNLLYVEGSFRVNNYVDCNDEEHIATSIYAKEVTLLEKNENDRLFDYVIVTDDDVEDFELPF